MKHVFRCLLAIITVMAPLVSCSRSLDIDSPEFVDDSELQDVMVLGERLTNPYSLNNMRAAYESLYGAGSGDKLKANSLYVRFLPADSTQLSKISCLELFDYPLDYEILNEGLRYYDSDIMENEITWQYANVPVDYAFPEDMKYEILDEC